MLPAQVGRLEVGQRRCGHVERRRRADAERAHQIQAGFRTRAVVPDEEHPDDLPGRDDEVEHVVGRQRIAPDAHAPGHRNVAQGHGRVVDRGGPARRQTGAQALDVAPLELERHLEIRDRLVAAVRQARRDGDPLAAREVLALEQHPRDAHVLLPLVAHPDRRQDRSAREAYAGGAVQSRTLEIADEDRLQPRQARILEDAFGQLERRPVAGCARAQLRRVDERPQRLEVGHRARSDAGPAVEEDQGCAVVEREARDGVGRGLLRLLPAVAVRHAVRAVDQDDHLARAGSHRGNGRRPEERPRERGYQQDEGGAPQQQQEPVPDPLAAERVEGDAAHEHQGGKLDDLLPLALDHVDDDGHGERPEPEQEQRREKCHQRTRLSFSRVARNLNSA